MKMWPLVPGLLIAAVSLVLATHLVADETSAPPPTPTPPTQQSDGEVIRIGPAAELDPPIQGERQRGSGRLLTLPGDPEALREQRTAAGKYYIGLAAVPVDPALRAHVDLPQDTGLLVEQVFEGSPAEDAGVEQYDIVVSADGENIREVADLVDVVLRHGGDNPSGFTLDLIRRGSPLSLTVTPSERPTEQLREQVPPDVRNRLRDRLGRFRGGLGGVPFGPGMQAVPFDLGQVPGGVSISIERKGDGPPKITVKRGDESWEVEGDDPESLEALPEELRPMVEGMLERQNAGGFDGELRTFDRLMPEQFGEDSGIEERLFRMEQQMRRLLEQLENDAR